MKQTKGKLLNKIPKNCFFEKKMYKKEIQQENS